MLLNLLTHFQWLRHWHLFHLIKSKFSLNNTAIMLKNLAMAIAQLRSNYWLFWGYLHWKVSSKPTSKGTFFAHPLWNMLHRTFNEIASWITLSWYGSTYLIYLVKEGFPCTVMIGAVKEEVSYCFSILTAIAHWGYTVLKFVPDFVIT